MGSACSRLTNKITEDVFNEIKSAIAAEDLNKLASQIVNLMLIEFKSLTKQDKAILKQSKRDYFTLMTKQAATGNIPEQIAA